MRYFAYILKTIIFLHIVDFAHVWVGCGVQLLASGESAILRIQVSIKEPFYTFLVPVLSAFDWQFFR